MMIDGSRHQRRNNVRSGLWLRQIIVFLFADISCRITCASSTDSASFPQPGIKPDPFVQASPLACAIRCKDGVLVVASHASVDEEPLLYFRQDSSDTSNEKWPFQDLPHDHQGPFRIQPVDTLGTFIVSAGWRADCERLSKTSRQIADEERYIYGDAPDASTLFGRYMALELSSYMAQCAVSERVSRDMVCSVSSNV